MKEAKILLSKSAQKQLDKIPTQDLSNIQSKLNLLLTEKDNISIKKLKGREALRIRSGKYRIIFEFEGNDVIVYAIAHRKDVYR